MSVESPAKQPQVTGLSPAQRRAIQRIAFPDIWASDLHLAVDGHYFDMRGREYELGIIRDEHEWIINPKGAQLGLTTTFIVRTAHWMTQRNWNHLYLLPLKTGSVTFVQGRIDPIIDSNAILKALFSRTDNRNHKQSKDGINWYIRGTNIETELREIPVDVLIVDERDKANEQNLQEHAIERLSGSKVNRIVELSTPTVEGHGVYGEEGWNSSDQMEWWVECPHCGSKQILTFEENILPWVGEKAEESECHCSACKRDISDERAAMNATGQWVPTLPGAAKRGYRITQLNSPTKTIPQITKNFFAGQRDSALLAAFFRNGLGLPYTAAGDKFTAQLLDKARLAGHTLGGIPNGPVYLGVDVQYDSLFVTGYTLNRFGQRQLWDAKVIRGDGTKTKWKVLEETYFERLVQWQAVIDAHPAKEEVEELSKKWNGRVIMGFEKHMPNQPTTANWHPHKHGEVARVTIDRTMAFDGYIKAFIDGSVHLTMDAREIGERMPKLPYNAFYHHHLQMVRVEQPNAQGTIQAQWVNGYLSADGKTNKVSGNKPDHWHHSGMFAFICSEKEAPLYIPAQVGDLFAQAGGFIGA